MKKAMYYVSPFVVIPIIFIMATLIEGRDMLKPIIPYVIIATLFLFSVVIGFLTSTKTKFDYIITAIVPFSVFFALFVSLFFDEGCDGMPQLSLHHALNMEYYKIWLPIAIIMMAITFFASFKPIRNIVKSKLSFKKFEK